MKSRIDRKSYEDVEDLSAFWSKITAQLSILVRAFDPFESCRLFCAYYNKKINFFHKIDKNQSNVITVCNQATIHRKFVYKYVGIYEIFLYIPLNL